MKKVVFYVILAALVCTFIANGFSLHLYLSGKYFSESNSEQFFEFKRNREILIGDVKGTYEMKKYGLDPISYRIEAEVAGRQFTMFASKSKNVVLLFDDGTYFVKKGKENDLAKEIDKIQKKLEAEFGTSPTPVQTTEGMPITTAEPTLAPGTDNKSLSLSNAELKDLNTFLSNFVEVGLNDYDEEWTKTRELMSFAVTHNLLNYNSHFSYEELAGTPHEYYNVIDESHIISTIERLFGRTPDLFSDEGVGIIYQNGKIYSPAGGGEFFGYVAQVDTVKDMKDGTYSVAFTVYETEYDFQLDKRFYEPVTTWSSETKTHAAPNGQRGQAVVKKVKLDGKDTYQLIKLLYS